MRLFANIQEGESFRGTLIGYKWKEYRNLDNSSLRALQLTFDIGFVLIKIEFIPYGKE